MHGTSRTAKETQHDAPRVGLLLDRPAGARLCGCTDGGRNQPLAACPHCRGEGWVR